MQIDIKIDRPDWSKKEHDQRVVIVLFEGQRFKWLPTYVQLRDIQAALDKCRKENEESARRSSII